MNKRAEELEELGSDDHKLCDLENLLMSRCMWVRRVMGR